jgi:hypothetical protein
MLDDTVIAALISTVGTLSAGLGTLALTSYINTRTANRQAQQLREEERIAARRSAYADLLGAAAEMRVQVETNCARHWHDMNVRIAAIQDHAVTVSLHASRSAVLSPAAVADAALAVSKSSSGISVWIATHAQLGDFSGPDRRYQAGETTRPDLSIFDTNVAEFFRLASASFE